MKPNKIALGNHSRWQPLAYSIKRRDKSWAFYSEHEFGLGRLLDDYPYNVLKSDAPVYPDYRGITTINHLWESIAAVAKAYNVNAFMGCASVPMEGAMYQNWLDRQLDSTKLNVKVTRKLPETNYRLSIWRKWLMWTWRIRKILPCQRC